MQRCYAAILFTDLCSATSLCEAIDPEFYAEIISQIRQISEETINKNNGLLNQFYGDGILAVFGFPNPREDSIYQATITALELHKRIRLAKRHPELPKNFSVKMHSGIDAGYIVADTGDHIQGQFKFAGNALNTAARLSHYAAEDEILVGKKTLQHELPFFITEKIKNINLKGKEKAISAYKVLEVSNIKTRFQAREYMGLTRFVGRKKELKRLQSLLEKSKLKNFNQINILSNAGLGKSRLVQEFLSSSYCTSSDIYQTSYQENNRPYFPIFQLLQQIFEVGHIRSNEIIHAKITTKLKQLKLDSPNMRRKIVHFLRNKSQYSALNQFSSYYFSETFANILIALTEEKTAILFIDDFHLSDNQTRLTLALLSQKIKSSRVLIITCSRSDTRFTFPSIGESLHLCTLDQHESKEVILHLLPNEKNSKIIQSIFEFSGGNPLFIEETCKIFEESSLSDFKVEIEGFDKFNNKMRSHLSPQLLWMIAQKSRLLPKNTQETIDCAAVIGERMKKRDLELLGGRPIPNEELIILSERGLIFEYTGKKSELTFRNGVTHSAIYQSINYSKRKYLHGKYAEILESQQEGSPDPNNWGKLALQFKNAGKRFAAGKYYALGADQHIKSLNYESARYYYVNALKHLDPEINTEATYHQWVAILFRMAPLCLFDASPNQLKYFSHAATLAKKYCDYSSYVKSQLWQCRINYLLGRSTRAVNYSAKVIEMAQAIGDMGSISEALIIQAQSHVAMSSYPLALQLFKSHNHAGDKNTSPSGEAYSLACQAFAQADQGFFGKANLEFESALKLAGVSGKHVSSSVLALFSIAKLWQGEWGQAKKLAEESKHHSQLIANTYAFSYATTLSAYAEWKLTSNPDLINTISEATAWLDSTGKKRLISLPYCWLCEMQTQVGNYKRSRHFAALTLQRSRAKDYFGQTMVYRCLSKLSFQRKQPHHTEKYLSLALRSAKARRSLHEEKQTRRLAKQLSITLDTHIDP